MSDATDQTGVTKFFYNQGALLLGLIGTTVAVAAWVQSPQVEMNKDLALIRQSMEFQQENSQVIKESIKKIETNHLTHLQNYAAEMKDLKAEQVMQGKIIVEILTKLDSHITK